MGQYRATNRLNVWPVVFPEEKLIVKRPCLRYICQGNTHLGELLSYFLYEVGKEAALRGIDPLLVHSAKIYRTQEEIIYGIDHSLSVRGLTRYLIRLQKLGYVKFVPHQHMYLVLVEIVRRELAAHEKAHEKHAHVSLILPPPVFQIADPQSDIDHESAKMPGQSAKMPGQSAKMPGQSAKMPGQSAKQTQFYIDPALPSQAASAGRKDDARYKRDIKESNREISGEADAIATPPSSLSSQSPIMQEPSSPQKVVQEQATLREMTAKLQNEQINVNRENNMKILDGGLEKPDCTQPVTVEALQALADYYRGYRLSHSKKPNSQYRMVLEAAITLVGRKKTLAEVDAVYAYMKGVNRAFCDDWWPLQTVDLWHVARHFDSMMRKIVHRRAYTSVASAISQTGQIRAMSELMEMPLEERKVYLSQLRKQMQQSVQ
jgi:hypothetical protein